MLSRRSPALEQQSNLFTTYANAIGAGANPSGGPFAEMLNKWMPRCLALNHPTLG